MKTFKVGQIVRYSNPQPGEETLKFLIKEIHEPDETIKEKLHVELICNKAIKPTFCHFAEEYEKIENTEYYKSTHITLQ